MDRTEAIAYMLHATDHDPHTEELDVAALRALGVTDTELCEAMGIDVVPYRR
jgi:hypothetical protein